MHNPNKENLYWLNFRVRGKYKQIKKASAFQAYLPEEGFSPILSESYIMLRYSMHKEANQNMKDTWYLCI